MAKQERVAFTSVLERFSGKGGMHYVQVPEVVWKQFTKTKAIRVLATLNDVLEFHCAIRPKGGGMFYINIGTPIRAKAKLKLGQKISFTVRLDKSEYGRKMPKELKELMAQDEEGNKLFHALTPSKQRGVIYYVDGAKSLDKRIERALMMINRLKNDPQSFH
jgi:hypothetical protein